MAYCFGNGLLLWKRLTALEMAYCIGNGLLHWKWLTALEMAYRYEIGLPSVNVSPSIPGSPTLI
jgi:hypothetical protein